MYEEYHYHHPTDPAWPLHPKWPPAQPPSEDGLPDRWCCLILLISWILIAILIGILCSCLPDLSVH